MNQKHENIKEMREKRFYLDFHVTDFQAHGDIREITHSRKLLITCQENNKFFKHNWLQITSCELNIFLALYCRQISFVDLLQRKGPQKLQTLFTSEA